MTVCCLWWIKIGIFLSQFQGINEMCRLWKIFTRQLIRNDFCNSETDLWLASYKNRFNYDLTRVFHYLISNLMRTRAKNKKNHIKRNICKMILRWHSYHNLGRCAISLSSRSNGANHFQATNKLFFSFIENTQSIPATSRRAKRHNSMRHLDGKNNSTQSINGFK